MGLPAAVTDICFTVGFSSLGTFSTRFSELVGVSPSAYRADPSPSTDGIPPCLAKQGFYRDLLAFEVRQDVGHENMRWLTVGPVGQPGTSMVLHPPGVDPGITAEEKETVPTLIAKGVYSAVNLASDDLDELFQRLEAAGADVVQEPTDQDYGVRDSAVRDQRAT